MIGLTRTYRFRFYRQLMMGLGLWPSNKYTMELWGESVSLLRRWLIESRNLNSAVTKEKSYRSRVMKVLQALALHGRNPSIREASARVVADISSRETVPKRLSLLTPFVVSLILMAVMAVFWVGSYHRVSDLIMVQRNGNQMLLKVKIIDLWLDSGAPEPRPALATSVGCRSFREYAKEEREKELIDELGKALDRIKGKDTQRDSAILAASRIINRIELEHFSHVTRDTEKNAATRRTYTTLSMLANVLGCLVAIFAIWTVRGLIQYRSWADDTIRNGEEQFISYMSLVKDQTVFLLDADYKISTWNQSAEMMTGYPALEIIGKKLSLLFNNREINARSLAEESNRRGGAEGGGTTLNLVGKDGTVFQGHLTLLTVKNNREELRSVIAILKLIPPRQNILTTAPLRSTSRGKSKSA